jgi:ribonuclease BN (tRNA processing enzyme)
MTTVFSVNHRDYETADEAIAVVEAAGSGSVIQFHVSRNLPGCLPEFVHRSCAMWTYQVRVDGVKRWMAHAIFGGTAEAYAEERPH